MVRSKRPVFIVGFPRSGTTLLYHMLLSSGGFAVYLTESHVFSSFIPRFGDLANLKNRDRMIESWLSSKYFELTGLDRISVESELRSRCRSGGDFLRIVMGSIADQQNVRRWAEKTPLNLMYLRQIKHTLPEALIVHVIRDGRDVALSMKGKNWIRTLSFDRAYALTICGINWEWMLEHGIEAGARFGQDYMEVRFEELVEKPDETLRRVGRFIDEDLDIDRIRKVGIGVINRPNSSFATDCKSFVPMQRWRKQFSRDELVQFESLVGRFLSKLGYELSVPEVELSNAPQLKRLRLLYRTYYSCRFWIKSQCLPGVRAFVKDSFDGCRRDI